MANFNNTSFITFLVPLFVFAYPLSKTLSQFLAANAERQPASFSKSPRPLILANV